MVGKARAFEATCKNRTIWFKAKKSYHNLQLVIETEEKVDRNPLIDIKIFKSINGNAIKRLKMR